MIFFRYPGVNIVSNRLARMMRCVLSRVYTVGLLKKKNDLQFRVPTYGVRAFILSQSYRVHRVYSLEADFEFRLHATLWILLVDENHISNIRVRDRFRPTNSRPVSVKLQQIITFELQENTRCFFFNETFSS